MKKRGQGRGHKPTPCSFVQLLILLGVTHGIHEGKNLCSEKG